MSCRLTRRAFPLLLLSVSLATAANADDDLGACPSVVPLNGAVAPRFGGTAESPVNITADRVEAQGDVSTFSGNVEVQHGTETIYADKVVYDRLKDEIQASGNVRVRNAAGDAMETPFVELMRESGAGRTDAVTFRFGQNNARGDARHIYFHGREQVRLDGARYTRCPEGQNDWFMLASEIDLDYTADVGTARHARIKFKSVPIFYWPYMSFPLSDQRKSGVLAPVFGTDTKNGFFLAIPYYFNIAPALDATVTPRHLAKRGVQWQTETRYLGQDYDGTLNYDYLYNDRVTGGNRYVGALRHHYYFDPKWYADVNLNNVSDPTYFEDLSYSLADAAQTHVPQKAEVRYADEDVRGVARFFKYQTLDKTGNPANVPYSRLPEILVSGDYPGAASGLRYQYDADFANFDHSTKVAGQRLGLFPSVSWPLRNSYAFAIPRVGVRHTSYLLNREADADPGSNIPIYSFDTGLLFERGFTWGGAAHTQTVEPRLFYTYIPYRNQDDQPNFDTGPQDFNFSNLFRENRFFGGDRVGDANQVAAGLTTRLLDPFGVERIRASVGQVYYFEQPRVYTAEQRAALAANPAAAAESARDRSYMVTQTRARLMPHWYARHDLQWDEEELRTRKSSFFVQYRPRNDKIVNVGHRYISDVIQGSAGSSLEQLELSTQWRLSRRWSGLYGNSYSLARNRNIESYAGLEYNACCWMGRFYVQRRVTQEQRQNNLYYFEFELSGLLKLGVSPIASPLARGEFAFDD